MRVNYKNQTDVNDNTYVMLNEVETSLHQNIMRFFDYAQNDRRTILVIDSRLATNFYCPHIFLFLFLFGC